MAKKDDSVTRRQTLKRITALSAGSAGIVLSGTATGSDAESTNDERYVDEHRYQVRECEGCNIIVLAQAGPYKQVEVSNKDKNRRYFINEETGSAKLVTDDSIGRDQIVICGQQDQSGLDRVVAPDCGGGGVVELIQWSDGWSGTIGSWPGPLGDKYEAGVAFTTGEDVGDATAGAIGGALCALIPIVGWKAAAACGAISSVIIDFDTAGETCSVGVWDEGAGFIGTPHIRIGTAGSHVFSHDGLSEQEMVPGYIGMFTVF